MIEHQSIIVQAYSHGMTVSDAAKVSALVQSFAPRRVEISIAIKHGQRTDPQNRRYWGSILPAVRENLSLGRELPLSKEQTHYVLKSAFIGVDETPLGPVPKSSRTLSVEKFKEFCDAVEAHFAKRGVCFATDGEPWTP